MKVLFEVSSPSSARSDDSLQKLPHRNYLLTIRHEDTQDELSFERVEALIVTHYRARTVDMIESYDRVSDLGETVWLAQVRQQLQSADEPIEYLQHIRLYLDDGPCYEFICHAFSASTKVA
jgi:hypothetical protein